MAYRYRFNEQRTFGCEFEVVIRAGYSRMSVYSAIMAEGVAVEDIHGYQHTVDSHGEWVMKTDISLSTDHSGESTMEIVSPILRGQAGLEQVKKVCKVLKAMCRVNKTCGFHVHHGATDLNDGQFRSLFRAGRADAVFFDGLMPASRRNNSYCAHAPTLTLPQSGVAEYIARRHGRTAINFASYLLRGAIEFRQHSGTVEYEKAVAWIVVSQSIMEWAVQHPDAHPRSRLDVEKMLRDGFSFCPLWERYGLRDGTGFEGSVYRFMRKRWQKFNSMAVAGQDTDAAEYDDRAAVVTVTM